MIKKILVFIVLMITPFIVLAYKPGDKYIKGDADNSGKVTSTDYIVVRKHILKQTTLKGDALIRSDTTGDNKITSVDYIAIRKMILNGKTGEVVTVPGETSTPKPLTAEEKICESVKNNASIDYKSFMSLKKDNDDYYAIKAAHDCANKYNKPIKVTKGEYNIYKTNHNEIVVKTSTNFNGSTIYIHDEISSLGDYFKDYIYKIEKNSSIKCTSGTINNFNNNLVSLAPNTGKYLIEITEQDGKTVWHRNKGNGKTEQDTAKSDLYRVYNGVLKDPMYWDYKGSKINYSSCPIPNDQLVFQNAIFKTITRNKCSKCDGYTKRSIRVMRSNTKLYNLKHYYVDKDLKKIYKIHHPYNGFYTAGAVADVIIEKCQVYPLHYETPSGGKNSTYDLYLNSTVNPLLKEVIMYEDSHNQMDDNNYWSVWSSGTCKNMVIEDSKLNVISAHKAVYYLTVRNTIIGERGVIVGGSGDRNDNKLILDNNTWQYSNTLIKIRQDYGTTWNGSISITNSKVEKSSASTLMVVYMPGMTANIGKYFGQPIYGPTKITIDGLKIKSSKINKIEIIDVSKSDYENYYLKKFQHSTNKNEFPKIIKNNITGISSSSIKNYG